MVDIPVMLRVSGRRVVIVGGGGVARRRAASLLEAGARVTVIAPRIDPEIEKLGVTLLRRGYHYGDLTGAFLTVVATDDVAVNQAVAGEAAERQVLVNRTDDPEAGDVQVPAHRRVGPVTIAVHSGGISAKAASAIRDQLVATLDPDWALLLQTVEPFRGKVQEEVADAARRQTILMKLADEHAMASLKSGGVEGLLKRCDAIVAEAKRA
jgi:precorrin-2 dehydrogenase/sirohydrochlorin ferrochelatase